MTHDLTSTARRPSPEAYDLPNTTPASASARPPACQGAWMKDGAPFGPAGILENWNEPALVEWLRTFAIITTDANELVAEISKMNTRLVQASESSDSIGGGRLSDA